MSLILALVSAASAVDDKYFLGQEPIHLKDIVILDAKLYFRARRLEKDLELAWRFSSDQKSVGVVRRGVGGRALGIGRGEEALVHSKDLYLSLDAVEKILNAKVTRGDKIVIDPKRKAGPDPAPKRVGLGPGDPMIDLVLPPLRGTDSVRLSSHKGKRILFVLWSSWDGSRDGVADWQRVQEKYRNAGLVVVACALGSEGDERIRPYADRAPTCPMSRDVHWRTVSIWDLQTLPRWILVDELGFIRSIGDAGSVFEEAWGKLGKIEEGRIKAWVPDDVRTAPELERELAKGESAVLRLALSRALWRDDPGRAAAEARKVLETDPDSWAAAIHVAAALWRSGKPEEGVVVLREYLKRKDLHTWARRQKWAVEFPEKIYAEKLDEDWLRAQEEKERAGG